MKMLEGSDVMVIKGRDDFIGWYAEGTYYNPYRDEMQNGLIVFENVTIGTDTANTFYSEYY